MKTMKKEHWRLLLDPPPASEGKWKPHQHDLVWIGPDVWRKVPPPTSTGKSE